jgi:hypothetical protein
VVADVADEQRAIAIERDAVRLAQLRRRVRRSRRRMRWLSRSQKYKPPSGPTTRPYGLLTCESEYPAVPVPTTSETLDGAASAVAMVNARKMPRISR